MYYFDEVADKWDTMVIHDEKKVDYLIKLLPIKPNWRILDVGCGTGFLVPYLLPRIPLGKIVENDISENMIKIASEKYQDPRISFFCGDAQQDNSLGMFDAVIAFSMFPHFENKEKAVESLCTKVRPGGIFAILHAKSREDLNKMHASKNEESIKNDLLPPTQTIVDWIEQEGLEILEVIDNSEVFAIIGEKKEKIV